ncbi:MAG: translation initiation factor IF-2 [bacterium]
MKKRVFEAAKELGVSSAELLEKLRAAGVQVKSNFSTITDEDINKIKPPPAEPAPSEAKPVHKTTQVEEKTEIKAEEKKDDPSIKIEETLMENIYASSAKRLEAIKKKEMGRDHRGTKTTFLRKKAGRKNLTDKDSAVKLAEQEALREFGKPIRITGSISVKDISRETGIKSADIIMYLMRELGLMATINQSLDAEMASLVIEHFGYRAEVKIEEEQGDILEEADNAEDLEFRPPVVTIMGHVDHGKTKLLDAIRHTNVVATETGGITQHIGAYQIAHGEKKITFLDTPGHESFTAMRARGAKVTDLAVMVVAADDGVMPQTVEAIDHARAAGVPILIAINKIDKPQANIERTKKQLSDLGLTPEEWGGETVFVSISAKMGTNIDDLLDMMFLVTEMQELKANPKRKAVGSIIEAQLDKGKGPVATVLVQNGVLYAGDYVVVGLTWGRVRAMENDLGERVPMAGPSTPVKIYGLSAVPQAGDRLVVVEEEKRAKEIAARRQLKDREEKMRYAGRITLQDLFQKIKDGQVRELKVIVKADVQGSVEVITESLKNIQHQEVRVNVIRAAVGEVKETDVMLAAASNAVVIAFRVQVNPYAAAMAAREKVEIRGYEVIYKLTDDVKQALVGMLAPEYVEEYTGSVEVKQLFQSARAGSIAGCQVSDGEISFGNIARLYRNGEMLCESRIKSLKRFKDSVKSVKAGFECGMTLEGTTDIQVGDTIKFYTTVEKRRETLE